MPLFKVCLFIGHVNNIHGLWQINEVSELIVGAEDEVGVFICLRKSMC